MQLYVRMEWAIHWHLVQADLPTHILPAIVLWLEIVRDVHGVAMLALRYLMRYTFNKHISCAESYMWHSGTSGSMCALLSTYQQLCSRSVFFYFVQRKDIYVYVRCFQEKSFKNVIAVTLALFTVLHVYWWREQLDCSQCRQYFGFFFASEEYLKWLMSGVVQLIHVSAMCGWM